MALYYHRRTENVVGVRKLHKPMSVLQKETVELDIPFVNRWSDARCRATLRRAIIRRFTTGGRGVSGQLENVVSNQDIFGIANRFF